MGLARRSPVPGLRKRENTQCSEAFPTHPGPIHIFTNISSGRQTKLPKFQKIKEEAFSQRNAHGG